MSARSCPGPLGVGSVLDEATAALYVAYGADFVVGPVLNPAVARLCNRRKVAYCPGCGTASEISQAEELGAEIVQDLPRRFGGRTRLRQVHPGAHALDAHHAHRRRGGHPGEHRRLVQGRRRRRGHRLAT